jgi:hypothetical protein
VAPELVAHVSIGVTETPVAPAGDRPDGIDGSATTVVNEETTEVADPAAFVATIFQ